MNAVEIEEAISALAEQSFEPKDFPYRFLEAFGNRETTIRRLRSGETNRSDCGGVLQTNNIHIMVAEPGTVTQSLIALKTSHATKVAKAKFVLATDGELFEAEDIISGETVACSYADFPNHFGIFLPLAGIATVKQVRDSAFDIRATGRLNKLYVELLKENPEWGSGKRRHDMNHFMARLIFCFFAEDTDIFSGSLLFSDTVATMSAPDASNTGEVVSEIFRAMNVKHEDRESAATPRWATAFPYVNGGLFSGSAEVPRFSKIARSYLAHIGNLDWTRINPDIFGSMIQAVADDEERGALGMHYTSRPNILKVLDPLFLDDLRGRLQEAGGNSRKLLNLRSRLARIRVFDPACGSGNFLVIAYKEMRAIEADINKSRDESGRASDIPLTNFRGIEIRDFAAEVARLALIIAEYQCDVEHRGKKLALAEFLPLKAENWITCGNALNLDWLSICPPTGTGVKLHSDDLFGTPLGQAEIDFDNAGAETYICGNPPYKGRNRKGSSEKVETEAVFAAYTGSFASLDYVANWIIKAAEYCEQSSAVAGLVATNSICQGEQVALLWPLIFGKSVRIVFAHTSFKWSNLASNNAGVTVVILGLSRDTRRDLVLYSGEEIRKVEEIGPYLVPNSLTIVSKRESPLCDLGRMYLGNMPKDGGNLVMQISEAQNLVDEFGVSPSLIRKFFGSEEVIHSTPRACLWIDDDEVGAALENQAIAEIVERVSVFRRSSKAPSTRSHASTPHKFVQISAADGDRAIVIPRVSSENRPFIPADYFNSRPVIGDKCFAIYDEPLWNFSLIVSRLHLVWIATVCVRLEMRFSYGNKIGWNTFPVPTLTDKNRNGLSRCAEDILLAREAHFPATIADIYGRDMPDDLREAHDRNDELLERIYIGRRFKNDTERLEKLFDMYAKTRASSEGTKKLPREMSA